MFTPENYTGSQTEQYKQLNLHLASLLTSDDNLITNLANAAALLNLFFININWVGFYLFDGTKLILGPFQGLPACTRIPLTNGVCGHAATTKKIIRIDDVEKFPTHITCDERTKAEIVIPILKGERLIGVLDIDSPLKERFNIIDEQGLQSFINTLLKYL